MIMNTFKPIFTFDELQDTEKAKAQLARLIESTKHPARYRTVSVQWTFWESVKWLVKHHEWKRGNVAYNQFLFGDPGYDDAPLEMTHIFHPPPYHAVTVYL